MEAPRQESRAAESGTAAVGSSANAALEQRKVEAEVAYLQAQASKLQAEEKKLGRTRGAWVVDGVKVIGALILGAGGVIATFTGYQLTELRKERMQLEIDRQVQQLDEARHRKADLDSALTAAQAQFEKTKADLASVATQLEAAKTNSPTDTASLDAAIAETKQISKEVNSAAAQLDDRTKSQLQRLQPKAAELAKQLITKTKEAGIVVKLISGLRTIEEQDALYARGRTVPGSIVTTAKRSVHNTGLAFDVGIFEDNRYIDGSPKYKEVGKIGKSLGLVWGGDWRPIADEPHFETPDAQDALRQLKPTP